MARTSKLIFKQVRNMVPITFYKWLNMQFNMPILSLVIICMIDLPFIMLAGYAISIRQNDYNFIIFQNIFYEVVGLNEMAFYTFVNVFNSFVWANLTVFYLEDVFRFHKDKTSNTYPWRETLEYLSIPERMMATPRDMVLYFHIFAVIACISVHKYLFYPE